MKQILSSVAKKRARKEMLEKEKSIVESHSLGFRRKGTVSRGERFLQERAGGKEITRSGPN